MIDEASERCVNVLLDLINTKVNYVVQEAIIVIKVIIIDIYTPPIGYFIERHDHDADFSLLTLSLTGYFPQVP